MDGSEVESRWVELRVHGVSGTPPEALLGVPHVRQVAGDDYSRFFVPVPEPTDHVVEGYHWGRFTSGSWRQAFTLLLVPFGMVNATQFMLPPPREDDRRGKAAHAVAGASLRAVSLVLTNLFTFALCLILVDLIGWRWSDKTRLLKDFPDGVVLAGCVIAAAVAFLLLSSLGEAKDTRRPPWSEQPDPPPGTPPLEPAGETGTQLAPSLYGADPNSPALRSLHRGVGLAMIAVLADLARLGMRPDYYGGPLRVVLVTVLMLLCLAVVLLGDPGQVVSVDWRDRAQRRKRAWQEFMDNERTRRLVEWGTGALVALEAVLVCWVSRPDVATVKDPKRLAASLRVLGYDQVADDLMYAGVASLLVLLGAVLVLRSNNPGPADDSDAAAFRPYAKGMTAFLLAAFAVFIGIGFSAGAATAVSSALHLNIDATVEAPKPAESGQPVESVNKAAPQRAQAGTTPMLDRVAFAWGLSVIELGLIGLAVYRKKLATKNSFLKAVGTAYERPRKAHEDLPYGWSSRVAGAMFVAQLKHALPLVITVLVGVGMAISAVQLVETWWCAGGTCGGGWWLVGWLSQPRSQNSLTLLLINLGAWVFVVGSGAVVTISRGAFKDTGLRRGINVVWDVFSFWPHTTHPFCPRPYSRWTVIELRNRIRFHLGGDPLQPGEPAAVPGSPGGHRDVVLCAHSQGSVISFAALMLLTPPERARVALLTAGSQLRVIYPRAFPAYFSFQAVGWMFDTLDERWVNLYRSTDPLAGPVLSWHHEDASTDHPDGSSRHFRLPPGAELEADQIDGLWTRRSGNDWRLIDPVPHDANVETGPVEVINGHHDYWLDPAWDVALAQLVGRLQGVDAG